jgi:uncharacterized repeat protein (TIGR01451 family)
MNATSPALGAVSYSIGSGVTVPAGLIAGSPVCVLVYGSVIAAFVPAGAIQVCGTVVSVSPTSLSLVAYFGATGPVTYPIGSGVTVPGGLIAGSQVCVVVLGGTVIQFTFAGSSGGSAAGLTLAKAAQEISLGNAEGTAITTYLNDTVQYRLSYSNGTGSAVTGPTLTDILQAGQNYVFGSCAPAACTVNPSTQTVTFTLPTIPAGVSSSVTFRVTVNTSGPAVISNVATLSSTNMATVSSNSTTLTIGPPSPGPGPAFYPPYNYYPYYPPSFTYPNYPPYNPYGSSFNGTVTVCGVISGYRPPIGGAGYIEINGENLILFAGMVPGGIPFSVGGSYCITFVVSAYGQITSLIVATNLPGMNYLCGPVSPFQTGYTPYGANMPYPGYTPYAGYNPYQGYGQYPGYGPYAGSGAYNGYYGWGGPIVIGGYPYQVAPNTYFPFSPQYGNPYCFMMNQQGYVSGSLSAVPTAATPAEAPSGTRLPARRGGL